MTSIFMRAGGKRRRSAEVKARKNGNEFVQLETWLADFDLLFFCVGIMPIRLSFIALAGVAQSAAAELKMDGERGYGPDRRRSRPAHHHPPEVLCARARSRHRVATRRLWRERRGGSSALGR